ncbi:UNVERIFIED_CONTAM: hypothetical protein ABIC26_002714 [Paenibacillus sp. PvR008]
MKDETRKVMVDGVEYSVDRTFDDSPAIYGVSSEKNIFINVNSKREDDRGFHIQSLLEGFNEEECVIILARKTR